MRNTFKKAEDLGSTIVRALRVYWKFGSSLRKKGKVSNEFMWAKLLKDSSSYEISLQLSLLHKKRGGYSKLKVWSGRSIIDLTVGRSSKKLLLCYLADFLGCIPEKNLIPIDWYCIRKNKSAQSWRCWASILFTRNEFPEQDPHVWKRRRSTLYKLMK